MLGLTPEEAEAKPYIASMGIYVFKKGVLGTASSAVTSQQSTITAAGTFQPSNQCCRTYRIYHPHSCLHVLEAVGSYAGMARSSCWQFKVLHGICATTSMMSMWCLLCVCLCS